MVVRAWDCDVTSPASAITSARSSPPPESCRGYLRGGGILEDHQQGLLIEGRDVFGVERRSGGLDATGVVF